MNREPAVTAGSITAVVAAILTSLVGFGVSLSAEQQTAIIGLVAVVGPLVAGLVTRGKVSPTVSQD